jgi:hypothetical protein
MIKTSKPSKELLYISKVIHNSKKIEVKKNFYQK